MVDEYSIGDAGDKNLDNDAYDGNAHGMIISMMAVVITEMAFKKASNPISGNISPRSIPLYSTAVWPTNMRKAKSNSNKGLAP